MINILGSIREVVSKLFYLAVSAAIGTGAAILLPVLALAAFAYLEHTGDAGQLEMLTGAMVVLGPLSCAFWFSVIWKGGRKDDSGFLGALARMFVGFVLSVGCMILVTIYTKPTGGANGFTLLYITVYAPVALLIVGKLLFGNRGPACVCNGENCFDPNCGGTIRRGFCTECHADMTCV